MCGLARISHQVCLGFRIRADLRKFWILSEAFTWARRLGAPPGAIWLATVPHNTVAEAFSLNRAEISPWRATQRAEKVILQVCLRMPLRLNPVAPPPR